MIYKGFRVVVTVGLEPTVTIRNRLLAALALAISLCSLELQLASSRTAGARFRSPIDVFTSRCRWFGSDYHRHNKNPPTRGGFLLCGDSWTRTNDPIDVNDVLYRLSHATTVQCSNRNRRYDTMQRIIGQAKLSSVHDPFSYGFTRSGRSIVWNTLL